MKFYYLDESFRSKDYSKAYTVVLVDDGNNKILHYPKGKKMMDAYMYPMRPAKSIICDDSAKMAERVCDYYGISVTDAKYLFTYENLGVNNIRFDVYYAKVDPDAELPLTHPEDDQIGLGWMTLPALVTVKTSDSHKLETAMLELITYKNRIPMMVGKNFQEVLSLEDEHPD